jgi:hypothetical protein
MTGAETGLQSKNAAVLSSLITARLILILVIQVGDYLLVSHGHQRRDFFLNAGPFYGAASRLIDIVEQIGRGAGANRSHGLCGGPHSPSWPIWWHWWAKSNIEARTLFDAAQLLKTE